MQRGHMEGGWAWSTPAEGYLLLISDLCGSWPGPSAPCPSQGPGLSGSSGQGWVWWCLLCGLSLGVGLAMGQPLWGKEGLLSGPRVVRAQGLLTSASHSLKACLQVRHACCQHLITVTPCSSLPALGSEETVGVYPSPTPQSWAWGL